jgi:hypothetical protein
VSESDINQSIDKLDLLFVIDNSASMGDKQDYLARAVPDLISRLVTPNCIDSKTHQVYGPSDSSGNGVCTQGTVEFPPVHDMHIGVMSTSLGTRLSDKFGTGDGVICDPNATVKINGVARSRHNDDQGRLLNRVLDSTGTNETTLADAGQSFYLNFFPSSNVKNQGKMPSPGAPAIQTPAQLISDFTGLIQGVGVYGCGIESQLESWYRFLVQPDPYATLGLDSQNHAQWQGVDTTILKQRHDFLRPDSLVAIVDLTDENDSEVDVRSLQGTAWLMMAQTWAPPRGTSGCEENATNTGLLDPSTCETCPKGSTDPDCMMGAYASSPPNWGFDPNLRHVHMMQKYGAWPQFPIERYQIGLTSKKVPDRTGEYPQGAGSYQGTSAQNQNCTNPLFAASLPDGSSTDPAALCNLPLGPRGNDLIYYAHIGGLPHQLLQKDPTNPDSPQKDSLLPSDWQKILGNNPENFDYTGIDPRMIESSQPRSGLPAGPGSAPDPASGYDWVTDQGAGHILEVDREYACIFPLSTPRECACSTAGGCDPSVISACDCPAGPTLTPEQIPPICNPTKQTQQTGAKAYPTQRELLLTQLMGGQGIVSSLCPIHVQPASGQTELSDPLFGYNPAVNGIVERLKTKIGQKCLPETLVPQACGDHTCLVLVTLPSSQNGEQDCKSLPGMSIPDQDILAQYQDQQHAHWVGAGKPGTDPSTLPTCQLQELFQQPAGAPSGCPSPLGTFDSAGSCVNSSTPGWCYVEGAAAGSCPQALLFTNGEPPSGATLQLQCVEKNVTAIGDGG